VPEVVSGVRYDDNAVDKKLVFDPTKRIDAFIFCYKAGAEGDQKDLARALLKKVRSEAKHVRTCCSRLLQKPLCCF
jgi:hypothetical protein